MRRAITGAILEQPPAQFLTEHHGFWALSHTIAIRPYPRANRQETVIFRCLAAGKLSVNPVQQHPKAAYPNRCFPLILLVLVVLRVLACSVIPDF